MALMRSTATVGSVSSSLEMGAWGACRRRGHRDRRRPFFGCREMRRVVRGGVFIGFRALVWEKAAGGAA
jgi:hypothetical protein